MTSTISKAHSFKVHENTSHDLFWDDLNKTKFLCLLSGSSLLSRTCFHPLALIKTRIQTEKIPIKSKLEMIKKISIEEGIRRGFYRGYSISIISILFEPVYMGTLEMMRQFLNNNKPTIISISQWDIVTSSLSPATAALIQQTFLVPIDVITQRLMITRSSDNIKLRTIINDIYYLSGDGIKGFYKGYLITLATSIPFNSIVWTFYWSIQSNIKRIYPFKSDYIISPLSSTIAALLTSLLTQPIDVLKTRLQVAFKKQSILETLLILIQKRGFKGLMAGSFVRASIIVPNGVIMMSLYEFIKRSSIKSSSVDSF